MQFFKDIFGIITSYYSELLTGLGYTLLIALIGTIAGLLIGILTGLQRTAPYSKNKILRGIHKTGNWLISAYVEIFRGTPMMVQAMVIFFGYSAIAGGSRLPLIPAGLFIVSINTGAYMSEIIRGGIISIDKGQFEGAYSVGMTHWQTMIHVVIPQMFRNILPSISNEFVINIKDTSVLNVIGVTELFFYGSMIIKDNFKTFQTYFIICVMYFIVTFTITRILRLIEKKLEGNGHYTICGSQSDPMAEIKVSEEN